MSATSPGTALIETRLHALRGEEVGPTLPRREPARIIVRRDREDLHQMLLVELADVDVEVLWDRRRAERRQEALEVPPDRRRGERRQRPPTSWTALGAMVVPQRRQDGGARCPPEARSLASMWGGAELGVGLDELRRGWPPEERGR